MNNKYYFSHILISLLYLSTTILAHRIHREVEHVSVSATTAPHTDDLDRTIVNQTGCKFLSLAKDEKVLFTKNSGDLTHTTLASLMSDETLVDQNQTNFEMHFAIRSAQELHVLLFTRRQYVNRSRTDSDYSIVYGTHENRKSYLTYSSLSMYGYYGAYKEQFTPDILSVDKYAKLYIKLDDKELKLGKQCARQPFYSEDVYNPVEFVQFGFMSKSENGAKILYDCPSNFAGCPCNWTVY